MYLPANRVMRDPVFMGPFSSRGIGPEIGWTLISNPTSATYGAANRIYYTPFYVGGDGEPYSLARWWWLNGATVGTNYLQVGIYDESFNLVEASPKTLSAGTASQVQYANPGISGSNITQGGSSIDLQTYTTPSVTMKAGVLYLFSVENSHASSAAALSSITATGGGAPTFTSRSTTQFNGTLNRISIWSCVPTVDYTGTLDINISGSGNTGTTYALNAFYHVDTTTNDGIVQNATGTGNSTTPLATLSAFGSADNATFGAFGVGAANTGTPSAGYFELSDQTTATPAQACQTVYRPDNDTTVDETITSAQWGACAVELKSLGTGAVIIPPMRGYLATWCNGTTATVFRNTQAAGHAWEAYLQSSAAGGLPSIATPASGTTNAFTVVCGFTRRSSP